ncbi:type II toxin-antitoxin system VapC family toxin [uncultured Modestobacter sp.]|uniref:type II toxin-antitoxin system VapC family toxin n=1 Tax=uncultured Modestobacter sp. TaxID=380048 RepID=UPI0026314126|nr:type II toxin-antitoxin system VapC family toxin [uncultured Modestobacter sp.]
MLYLDTSVLIALVTAEPRSAALRSWAAAVDDVLVTSDWSLTEAASGLSIKQRTAVLTEVERLVVDRALSRFLAENVEVVGVHRADYRTAARLSARPTPPLRAADALHLAVAARHDAVLHTLDDQQAAGARAHDIGAVVPVPRA